LKNNCRSVYFIINAVIDGLCLFLLSYCYFYFYEETNLFLFNKFTILTHSLTFSTEYRILLFAFFGPTIIHSHKPIQTSAISCIYLKTWNIYANIFYIYWPCDFYFNGFSCIDCLILNIYNYILKKIQGRNVCILRTILYKNLVCLVALYCIIWLLICWTFIYIRIF